MIILDVTQGSPEWKSARAQHLCASDAPAMMGGSKYTTRNALLKQCATGITEEIDSSTQYIFDKGHAAEAAIRPYIETLIGEDLYPVVAVNGDLLASFDGLTMDGKTGFEHKLWSESLSKAVNDGSFRDDPTYYWQLEHHFAVNEDMVRVHFVVSDGTPDRCVSAVYEPVPGRAEALAAGWRQFREDLAAYKPQAAEVACMATPVESLPAVSVRMDGAIAVISNLDVFGSRLKTFIEGIDKSPSTDQAFADAEAAIKTLEKAQTALEQAEAAALAQTSSIDDMRRTVALYADMARTTRLMLEKVVKSRKEQIRIEIQQAAQAAFNEHCAAINKRLGKVSLPAITPAFANAMKGKKTVTSVRSAVDDELARAKIEASAWGEKIDANLRSLRELAADHSFLFADAQQIVLKANEDLVSLIKTRIAEHKVAEDKRLEAEREKIRGEEQAKAQIQAAPVVQPEILTAAKGWPAKSVAKRARPADSEIIEILATHYHVSDATVIGWLNWNKP